VLPEQSEKRANAVYDYKGFLLVSLADSLAVSPVDFTLIDSSTSIAII